MGTKVKRLMTVKELRELIAGADDKAVVVVPSYDHSYRFAVPVIGTALYNGETLHLSEDFGDANPDDMGKHVRQIPVVIVR